MQLPPAETTTTCALHWPSGQKYKHWTIIVPTAKQIPADTTTQEETPAMLVFVATFPTTPPAGRENKMFSQNEPFLPDEIIIRYCLFIDGNVTDC